MSPHHSLRRLRHTGIATAAALALAVAFPALAYAHAAVSPPVAKTGVLQQFTLAVPTEDQGARTTKIEMTVPAGFEIDSFEPEPGWTRTSQAGGAAAVVKEVTWTARGSGIPFNEDAVFRFQATLTQGSKDYVFAVRQFYSNGQVVDWNGPETVPTPSPRVQGVSSFGGGSSTIALIAALILGGLGLLVGVIALVSGRRPLT